MYIMYIIYIKYKTKVVQLNCDRTILFESSSSKNLRHKGVPHLCGKLQHFCY